MIDHPEYLFLGACGAAAFELLKIWDYRGKLKPQKFERLIRSPMFWSILLGMLVASGFFAWVFNVNAGYVGNEAIKPVVLTGIAARTILREVTAAGMTYKSEALGDDDSISARDIF